MRVPYFIAKDKDSDQWVEGFYAEFPEYPDITQECRMIHAIMTIVPDTSSLANMHGVMGIMGGFVNGEPDMQQFNNAVKNTLGFCTIDINTLQQIGEVEVGSPTFKAEGYVKNPRSSIVLGQ